MEMPESFECLSYITGYYKLVLKLCVEILEKHSVLQGMEKARQDITALLKQKPDETYREYSKHIQK